MSITEYLLWHVTYNLVIVRIAVVTAGIKSLWMLEVEFARSVLLIDKIKRWMAVDTVEQLVARFITRI